MLAKNPKKLINFTELPPPRQHEPFLKFKDILLLPISN